MRRFRGLIRRGGRIVARSRIVRIRVLPAPFTPVPAPAPGPVPASAPIPPSPPPPLLDPAQLRVEGTGGPPSPQTLALLANPRVVLSTTGAADLRAGRIDPRIVAVLSELAKTHTIAVGAMCSDHPQFSGGAVSPHYLGRGVDIAAVDGSPTGPGQPAGARARRAGRELPARPGRQPVGHPRTRLLHRRGAPGHHPHRVHAADRPALDAAGAMIAAAARTFGESITVEMREADPYPAYERMRREFPVCWVPAVGLWFVTRWADVQHVNTHPEIFSAHVTGPPLERALGTNVLTVDGAMHKGMRDPIEAPLKPKAVDRWAAELITPIAERAACRSPATAPATRCGRSCRIRRPARDCSPTRT